MQRPPVPAVDVREAAARLASPAAPPLLVDVRERDEFAAARVEGAALVPLSDFVAHVSGLPRDRPLLMFCAGGTRSAMATQYLIGAGFTDVANVTGGITAWHAAGLPVRSGPVAPGEGDLPTTG